MVKLSCVYSDFIPIEQDPHMKTADRLAALLNISYEDKTCLAWMYRTLVHLLKNGILLFFFN